MVDSDLVLLLLLLLCLLLTLNRPHASIATVCTCALVLQLFCMYGEACVIPPSNESLELTHGKQCTQGQKRASDLMAAASYVSVDMATAALAIVGAPRFLASANAYMLPGTAFATVSWKKLLKTKDAEEVSDLHACCTQHCPYCKGARTTWV
jgi:hypothetical protein